MMTTYAQIDIRPMAGSLGAEIRGVDLKAPIGDNLRKTLRSALLDHLVLFFPDQFLETHHLKAFGRTWGDLVAYEGTNGSPADDPEIVELAASAGLIPDVWHTDQSYQPDPPLGSILSMIKAPPVGGDTMWTNQWKAYDHLSAPMKDFLEGLTALHSLPASFQARRKVPTPVTEHPLVRVHPETGRRVLYINRLYTQSIPQLAPHEGAALLSMLLTHCEDPRFIVRYSWSEGATAIWDNRCTQHSVVADFTGERFIRRVTVGDSSIVPANSRWPNYHPSQNTAASRLAAGGGTISDT